MGYDKNNLETLMKEDLHNYPCPQCKEGAFIFKSLEYVMSGPVKVDVGCYVCEKEQQIKFHVNVV